MSRILHLEGNPAWLPLCRRAYTAAAADCAVFPVPEIQQAAFLPYILPLCRPSFLVLTGHDRADGTSAAACGRPVSMSRTPNASSSSRAPAAAGRKTY